jgi:excinuclease UvrABC nuclease subunit
MKYCVFAINSEIANKKGLYFYEINGQIKYIGRCLDNFKKRINWGYGTIHPKNCFLDGQSTNCHLNSLITENKDKVNLWVCLLSDNNEIKVLEKKLIGKYNPEWNLQLLKKSFSIPSRPG